MTPLIALAETAEDIPATQDVLASDEREERDRCEAIIDRSLRAFLEVGNALMAIRDRRLYRETHGTFEAYCRDRWGMKRSRAYQLIDAAAVLENVHNCGQCFPTLPENEAQVRPLASLTPDRQCEAWRRAIETAPDGKVTAAHVEAVAREYRSGPEPEPPWDIVAAAAHADRTIARLFEAWPVEHHEILAAKMEAFAGTFRRERAPDRVEPMPPERPERTPDNKPFTYGSVCSGIEAATVAWEPIGWKPKWFAEIAEFPSAVLAHRYPDVPNLGDFTTIGEEHGSIDLLVGGTPCQAFSVNGLRGGLRAVRFLLTRRDEKP